MQKTTSPKRFAITRVVKTIYGVTYHVTLRLSQLNFEKNPETMHEISQQIGIMVLHSFGTAPGGAQTKELNLNPWSKFENLFFRPDISPIIRVGCLRSVWGVISAVHRSNVVNIRLEIFPLDCHPFYHECGENCGKIQSTVEIWKLPVTDINRESAIILFYITCESGFLFLGNEILHQSYRSGPENILHILSGTRRISSEHLLLCPYFEPTGSHDSGKLWMNLSLFCTFKSFSILEKDNATEIFVAVIENRFAFKLS